MIVCCSLFVVNSWDQRVHCWTWTPFYYAMLSSLSGMNLSSFPRFFYFLFHFIGLGHYALLVGSYYGKFRVILFAESLLFFLLLVLSAVVLIWALSPHGAHMIWTFHGLRLVVACGNNRVGTQIITLINIFIIDFKFYSIFKHFNIIFFCVIYFSKW